MAKKHRGGDHGEIHQDERWLITYADMITLLLAVFIVMYALSDTNLRKFNAFAQSLSTAFATDVFSGSTQFTISTGQESAPSTGSLDAGNGVVEQQTRALQAVIKDQAIRQGLGEDVSVDRVPEGIAIRIRADNLFQPGRARLGTDATKVLETIAERVQPMTQSIRVVGHTDDTPTTGALYADNFELSVARAMAVMRFLQAAGIPPDRLSLAGAGQYDPLPDVGAGDPSNRRVDILLLNAVTPFPEPSPDTITPSLTPVFGDNQ